ncbi:MAG: hypothetical protein GEU95_10525 [Rhizobiales bacterium]|nr:hypothetical protein [Hyphomicrobiales bacterium]
MKRILLTIALLANTPAVGQTIDCTMSQLHSFKMENVTDVHGAKPRDVLQMTFADLDIKNQRAMMVGNLGSTELLSLRGPGKLSFLEITSTGNLMTTSISAKPGSWWGVHQRQAFIGAVGVISTYAGQCKIR